LQKFDYQHNGDGESAEDDTDVVMSIVEATARPSPGTIAKSNRRRKVKGTVVNGNWHMGVTANEFIHNKPVIEFTDGQTVKWILVEGFWSKDEDEQHANVDCDSIQDDEFVDGMTEEMNAAKITIDESASDDFQDVSIT